MGLATINSEHMIAVAVKVGPETDVRMLELPFLSTLAK